MYCIPTKDKAEERQRLQDLVFCGRRQDEPDLPEYIENPDPMGNTVVDHIELERIGFDCIRFGHIDFDHIGFDRIGFGRMDKVALCDSHSSRYLSMQ